MSKRKTFTHRPRKGGVHTEKPAGKPGRKAPAEAPVKPEQEAA